MSERDAAWQNVAERFRSLGQRFKEHYDGLDAGATTAANEDARKALQELGEALDRVFTSTGNALRDDSVREEGKKAASALGDAVGLTLTELGDELRRVVGRRTSDLERGFGDGPSSPGGMSGEEE